MSRQVHIQELGADRWQITRVDEPWGRVYDYKVVARVVLDGGDYYVEHAKWSGDKQEWERQPRPWRVARGALRSACDYAMKDEGDKS